MSPKQLKILLRQAIEDMLAEDAEGRPGKPLWKTGERNLSAHLFCHVTRALGLEKSGYQVDTEYIRMGPGEVSKHSCLLKRNVVPDMIVHRRGVEASQDPAANQLAVEVKIIPKFDGSVENIGNKQQRDALGKDLDKLDALRSLGGRFKYEHTASVVFSGKAVWIALDGPQFEMLMCL